jgi:bifunctional DNA-binding transcriptional regulator/antitoxin component of YhaV-PrlF toxin-antitoxin module
MEKIWWGKVDAKGRVTIPVAVAEELEAATAHPEEFLNPGVTKGVLSAPLLSC